MDSIPEKSTNTVRNWRDKHHNDAFPRIGVAGRLLRCIKDPHQPPVGFAKRGVTPEIILQPVE
jgi:hypothetical protein